MFPRRGQGVLDLAELLLGEILSKQGEPLQRVCLRLHWRAGPRLLCSLCLLFSRTHQSHEERVNDLMPCPEKRTSPSLVTLCPYRMQVQEISGTHSL
jgi:hypothetical protein